MWFYSDYSNHGYGIVFSKKKENKRIEERDSSHSPCPQPSTAAQSPFQSSSFGIATFWVVGLAGGFLFFLLAVIVGRFLPFWAVGLDLLLFWTAVRQKIQQFLNAARTGNLDLFRNLAAQLGDGKVLAQTVADVKDANKRGALHFAAREGQAEVCKYLVEELKLTVDARDEDGDSPLLRAARQGHTTTAKYLIECGANPNIASELGATDAKLLE